MNKNVPVKTASEETGLPACTIRHYMKTGRIDLGVVIAPEKKGGNWRYLISRSKLDKFKEELEGEQMELKLKPMHQTYILRRRGLNDFIEYAGGQDEAQDN